MWTTIFSAGIGAFFASFAAKYAERWFRISSEKETRLDGDVTEVLNALDGLKDLCFEYWLSAPKELVLRESALKAEIPGTIHYINLICTEMLENSLDDRRQTQAEIMSLMHLVTGGEFGDPGREAEPEKLRSVSIKILSLKRNILQRRRRMRRHLIG